MNRRLACLAAVAGLLAGAAVAQPVPVPDAPHTVLDAFGPQAGHIVDLWRLFVGICSVVFGLVLAALLLILWRRPRVREAAPPDLRAMVAPEPGPQRKVALAVGGASLLLLVLVVASVFTDRAIARLSLADAIALDVTGHQWWWSVRYLNGPASEQVETANEIHVPVGRPVVVRLTADDVIHSLWLPNLAGKRDLIPGRTSTITFRADKPGVYRGQCAEFCGYQHAKMGLFVVAEPPEQFDAWLRAQRASAAEPGEPQARRGLALFQSVSCAMCHAVQGTSAQGRRGPDLTHVASRQSLAAGTLPNTPQDLSSWIADPQKHKPGTNMPATPLSAEDLQALVAYLGTLK